MCDAEVALNRRTAPGLYRGVTAITRAPDGTLAFDGSGVPVDWVVEMERFAQSDLLDRRATAGRLDVALMAELGRVIAAFHAAAAPRLDRGGSAGMSWVVEGNAAGFEEFGRCVLDPNAHRRLSTRSRGAVSRQSARLDRRRRDGFVRQCHGDLHLRNIVLLGGVPVLFDAIEFNDDIACVDVLYDLAFLLMDLSGRGLPGHANAVWNAYLGQTEDFDDLPLMPLFLSCRAAVRAKTSATTAALQAGTAAGTDAAQRARDYLSMAADLLNPRDPQLIGIGGFSGSGKSTLAHQLAPAVGAVPGAVVLRSDLVRKRLLGVEPLQHLAADAYAPDVNARVYETLASQASRVIRGGHSAIVDAVHSRPEERHALERVASEAGVRFTGLWLDVPVETRLGRTRRRLLDPSDADETVVRMQLSVDPGQIGWRRLDAEGPTDIVAARAARLLKEEPQAVDA
jgi:aminoglycoside phosphotransferase family enzyme/cytidylate kinase